MAPPRHHTSFSDNPILRVSRPVSACSRCRSAKVKCDGKLPACTACERAGRETECSAANDQFARGKERSYVAALELRIEKLERMLTYARSRKASVTMHDPDTTNPAAAADAGRKDSLANIRDAIHRKAARKRENSDVDTLVSDFGYMSINATTRDFEPSVGNMTFARLVLAASTNDAVPDPATNKLPAEPTARSLIEYYLNHTYPLYPAFPEASLTSLVDDLYQETPRPVRSSESWLFWLVLAIGSAAQSRNTGDQYYLNGLEFVARALPHADRALTPGYVAQLQALLLLTQYSMLDPSHFDSWHLIGFTCRALVDLGFHQDPPSPRSSEELEARRRTFYCIYALDRAISMVHARPFSFTDDAMSVALPAPLPSASSGPDRSVHLFKFRCLQSNWYQILVQGDSSDPLPDATSFKWEMCRQMRDWHEKLPSDLAASLREMLDLELRFSYVYVIAPSPRAPHLTEYGRALIFEHAIAYIHRIHLITETGTRAAFYTYHDALKVYFMGTQFVAVLRDAADALLSPGTPSAPMQLPTQPAPPPFPPGLDEGGDNLERSLRTLEKVSLTLKRYGERWEYALQLLGTFEMMASEVVDALRGRKQQSITNMQQQVPPLQYS